jgi:acyl carrier protein
MLEKVIADTLGIDEGAIKDESNFVEDLGADSLNIVELVMEVEQTFDMEIPDEDAEELHTVAELKKYIEDYS